jgi:hypothetical protein
MRKKMRKFAEGGYDTAEGENENIKEDTRSRARKWVEEGSPEQDTDEKPVTVTKTSVTTAKPKTDTPYSKPTSDYVNPEKGLESVSPEDYIPGAGLMKGMLKKVVSMGAKRAEKTAAEGIAKNVARKSEEGFSPDEAVKQLKPVREAAETAGLKKEASAVKKRIAENDVVEKRLRTRIKNDEGSESVRARASKLGMKSGGSVKSSQLSKSNGIAQRGLTRGKMC